MRGRPASQRSRPKSKRGTSSSATRSIGGAATPRSRTDRSARSSRQLAIAWHSFTKIGAALGITRDLAGRVLRNRAYLGEIHDTAYRWIKGKHPPIVDVATFARAQAALDGRRRTGPGQREAPAETSTWILRDVARGDGCGAKMSAAYAGLREARRYYYKCAHNCTRVYVRVRDIEAQAGPLIVARFEELKEELALGAVGEPFEPPHLTDLTLRTGSGATSTSSTSPSSTSTPPAAVNVIRFVASR